jgi:hypothetical protein
VLHDPTVVPEDHGATVTGGRDAKTADAASGVSRTPLRRVKRSAMAALVTHADPDLLAETSNGARATE